MSLGNYIDLSTGKVTRFESDDEAEAGRQLRKAVALAPAGAILASGMNAMALPVKAAILAHGPDHGDISEDDFTHHRLQFDLTRYEDTGHGTPVDDLYFEDIDLADPGPELVPGTRLVLRFRDHGGRLRHFRLLVHPPRPGAGRSFVHAFRDPTTILQFEELAPRRIVVPLGIEKDAKSGGLGFATSENIPAHFVSASTRSVMWSVRPSSGRFVARDYFDKFYPLAMLRFFRAIRVGADTDMADYEAMPGLPDWAGSVHLTHLTSRSYMNTTMELFINDGGRPSGSELREERPQYQPIYGRRTVWTHRFKYELLLADGENTQFIPYDPPMDVEDEH